MSTSGSINFSLSRDQIAIAAFRKVNAFATSETPDADSLNAAVQALNAMIKAWVASGIHLWTETEGVLWLTPDQYKYPIGGATSNRAVLASGYTKTTLSADAASGASTITLTATTGFAASQQVGVVLDDGSLHWTTQNGALAGSVATLTAVLTDSAASGNLVFTYATALQRPLRIVGARRVAWSATATAQIETPLRLTARLDYHGRAVKASSGVPNELFYDPQLGSGQVYLWPAPEDSLSGILFTFFRTIEDFDAAADTADLPQEWHQALIWNLAQEIALDYDVSEKRYKMIRERAGETLSLVAGWDREPESLFFGPDIRE